jgi:drug/metabolite transporter (DMT)-like permease
MRREVSVSVVSILLVVLAAFIHATWNMLSKRAASVGPIFVFAYNLFACIAYAPWVAYLLLRSEGISWSIAGIGVLLASGLLHLAYSLCLQRGYQVADLSVVYPVARGSGPLLSTVGAILLLGELPSLAAVLGLFLVVGGIGLIATQGNLAAFERKDSRAGVKWGFATGGLIASYTVVDAFAVKILAIAPVVLDWFNNLLRFFLLLPLVLSHPGWAMKQMRGHWVRAILVGLLSPLSYIFVLTALEMGAPLTVVAPMREMSMMVGAIMGMVILREEVTRWRLIGCAVMIAGVVALAS